MTLFYIIMHEYTIAENHQMYSNIDHQNLLYFEVVLGENYILTSIPHADAASLH